MQNTLILLLFSISIARAGFERSEAGARPLGLAGAYTALAGDVWSAFYNPAGLARLAGAEAGFFLSPRPYGLGELSYSAAAAAVSTPAGVLALTGSRFGFDLYREEMLGLSIAVPTMLGEVGVTVVRYAVSIERYGSASAFGLNAGCSVELDRALRMGFRLRNLNAPRLGAAGERLRESAALGLAYRPVAGFLLSADMVKELHFDPSLRTGAEYAVVPAFIVRFGITDGPSEVHGGFGLREGLVSFDYAFSFHEDLGLTHECSLSIRWGGGGGDE